MLNHTLIFLLIINVIGYSQIYTWKISKVEFKGNKQFSDRELRKQISQKPDSVFSYFSLVSDIETIKSMYRSRGFYQTAIKLAPIKYDSSKSKVRINFAIQENKRTKINSITFVGKTAKKNVELLKIIPIKKHSPLDSESLMDSRALLIDSLLNYGYWYADIQYSTRFIDSSFNLADVTFFILQGPVILTGDTYINGTSKVRQSVVQRELRFKPNEVLTLDEIKKTNKSLNATGLFSSVQIIPVDTLTMAPLKDTFALPVRVDVKEGDMYELNGDGGYDSYEKYYLSLLLGYKNLFGLGNHISAEGRVSSVIKGGYLRYLYPWILQKPINGNFSLFIERQNQQTYNGLFNGGALSVDGNWKWSNSYAGRIRLDHTQWIHYKSDTIIPFQQKHKSTLAFGGLLRKDTRISPLQPGTAIYASGFSEIAGPFMAWSNQFFKLEFDFRNYLAFKEYTINFASAVFLGMLNGYGKNRDPIPSQELYRIGINGIRPVRGYVETEVSPTDPAGNSIGGRCVFIMTPIDIRSVIYRWFSGGVFIDAGREWLSINDFSLTTLKWSIGPELLVNSPLGLLRFEYGIQLQRSPKGRFLFNLGLPF